MPQPEDPRHNLRLSLELQKKLKHAAVDNGRSMNAEILDRLERSFEPAPLQSLETLLNHILSSDEKSRSDALTALATIATVLAKR